MCNLFKVLSKKRVTAYKVVYKIKVHDEIQYRSLFAFTRLQLGKVHAQTIEDYNLGNSLMDETFSYYHSGNVFYNDLVVGKTTGFKDEEDARTLCRSQRSASGKEIIVLKLTLGGELAMGDSTRVSWIIPDDSIIYAGTEILNMEEV